MVDYNHYEVQQTSRTHSPSTCKLHSLLKQVRFQVQHFTHNFASTLVSQPFYVVTLNRQKPQPCMNPTTYLLAKYSSDKTLIKKVKQGILVILQIHFTHLNWALKTTRQPYTAFYSSLPLLLWTMSVPLNSLSFWPFTTPITDDPAFYITEKAEAIRQELFQFSTTTYIKLYKHNRLITFSFPSIQKRNWLFCHLVQFLHLQFKSHLPSFQ